jgi:hypothetical protein
MTCYELIKSIVNNPEQNGYDMDKDDCRKLIAIAYYMGREGAARRICNEAQTIFKAQKERAHACRYHNMAMEIQGDITQIYSPDYAGEFTSIFGEDETRLSPDDLK